MLKINGEDLARITKNCMMFVNPKSLWIPGEVYFELTGDTISCYACDDYFAVTDSAPLIGKADIQFVLSLDDVKSLEAFSRKNKKEEIQISFGTTGVDFDTTDESISFNFLEVRDNWDTVYAVILDEAEPAFIHSYMSNPERYAKLSQLKYNKNTECITWFHVQSPTGQMIIRFEVGKTLKGAIMPLRERQESLDEKGSDDEASISLPD